MWWLDEADATNQHLAYINDAGNAVMKVDNTSDVALEQKRNTVSNGLVIPVSVTNVLCSQVRITTQQAYDVGSLWCVFLYVHSKHST